MRTFFTGILFFILVPGAQAKKLLEPSEALLKETTAKYRVAAAVELSVEKILKTELNPQGQKFSGKIFLSAGLFRIENLEPEKSTLVFDGSFIWNEQPPSPDFPGPTLVSKTKLDQKNKSQILFATLLTKEPITKNFKILSSKIEDGTTFYEAEAFAKDINVNSLTIRIRNKEKEVSEISYKDEIGNLTQMSLFNTKFLSKKNKKLFQYMPPKGAQVTNI